MTRDKGVQLLGSKGYLDPDGYLKSLNPSHMVASQRYDPALAVHFARVSESGHHQTVMMVESSEPGRRR